MATPGLEDEPRHVEDEGGGNVSTTLAVLAQHPAKAANFCPETIIRLLSLLSSRYGLQFSRVTLGIGEKNGKINYLLQQ